jgi:lipoate-protein ligase B
MMPRLDWTFLGEVPYSHGLEIQYAHARKVAEGADPVLFLMEHPLTITLGRQADPGHLKLSEQEYAERSIGVFRVLRGGEATCHGPGQLVGYPVASLDSFGCSVPAWVRGHANALMEFLNRRGVEGHWSDLHPGVWVGKEKIAALGFHISRRVSTHGFALNLDLNLSCFETIVPCGIHHLGVTSLAAQSREVPPMIEAAGEIAELVAQHFGWSVGAPLVARPFLEESLNGSSLPGTR